MTVAELERAVARLGFAPSIEDGGELLRDALDRALCEIATVHPRECTATLYHTPPRALYTLATEKEEGGAECLSLAGGASFFLRVQGVGSLCFTRGAKSETYYFSTAAGEQPAVLGGNIEGEGALTLRFEGTHYRLLSFAVYAERFTGTPPDPLSPVTYHLPSLFPSFGGLTRAPEAPNGVPLKEGAAADYTKEARDSLALSPRLRGRIILHYRRRLAVGADGAIPVSEEEAALLPLFCAAYVYLDDDPDKAAFYLARFREGLARLSEDGGARSSFPDKTHWG